MILEQFLNSSGIKNSKLDSGRIFLLLEGALLDGVMVAQLILVQFV